MSSEDYAGVPWKTNGELDNEIQALSLRVGELEKDNKDLKEAVTLILQVLYSNNVSEYHDDDFIRAIEKLRNVD